MEFRLGVVPRLGADVVGPVVVTVGVGVQTVAGVAGSQAVVVAGEEVVVVEVTEEWEGAVVAAVEEEGEVSLPLCVDGATVS